MSRPSIFARARPSGARWTTKLVSSPIKSAKAITRHLPSSRGKNLSSCGSGERNIQLGIYGIATTYARRFSGRQAGGSHFTSFQEPLPCFRILDKLKRVFLTDEEDVLERKPGALAGSTALAQWCQAGCAGCSGMLPLSATLCCQCPHSQCIIILPPGAIQPCHVIRSGLDCQIQRSAAAGDSGRSKQEVGCGLLGNPHNPPQS